LTDSNVAETKAFLMVGKGPTEIQKIIGRSSSAIRNIKGNALLPKTRRTWQTWKTITKTTHPIKRKARTGKYSAHKLRKIYQADVFVLCDQQVLSDYCRL